MEYSQRVMFWKVKIKMGAHLSNREGRKVERRGKEQVGRREQGQVEMGDLDDTRGRLR